MTEPGARAELTAIAVAAVVSGTPSTVHSLVTRRPVLATVRAAATLVPLPRRSPSTARDLVAGGLAHAVVSLVWGSVLARLLPPGRRTVAGALAGVAIHVLDLGVIARVMPRLAPMRDLPPLPQLADHVAFGATVGFLLDHPITGANRGPGAPGDP